MNLHIAEFTDFPREVADRLFNANIVAGNTSPHDTMGATNDAHVLWVRLRDYIGREYLDRFPNLETIVTPTTGLNHIDLEECERRGITVLSLAGEVDFLREIRSTAELTIGLMLSLLRKIPAAVESVKRGEWDRDKFKGRDLAGTTVAVIGAHYESPNHHPNWRYGRIACQVLKSLRCFGAGPVVIHQELFRTPDMWAADCDIVTLHANYTPENDKMCDAKFFAAMKPGALFINTARGELVDEGALMEALCSGHLGGAALDVLNSEQSITFDWSRYKRSHPLVAHARRDYNLIITPHIGGCTHESMEKAEIFMAHKLLKHLEAPIASG